MLHRSSARTHNFRVRSMTPRRALVMRTFAVAYLERLTPAERISFLAEQLLSIQDPACCFDLERAAIDIDHHAEGLNYALHHPFPNNGVSP
jgi:hypothetical protein